MKTDANTPNATTVPSIPTVPNVPANPAKGNLQGQTTLAAKIDRWMALSNNLGPQIDQLPQFRDQITQFQGLLVRAQAVRDRLKVIKGDGDEAVKQRDALFAEGDELFIRLSHALKAVHGPRSGRLRDYGLKPRKVSRPRKAATPLSPLPPGEVRGVSAGSGGAQEAQGTTAAPGSVK